jgi:uncharacterized membrane protein
LPTPEKSVRSRSRGEHREGAGRDPSRLKALADGVFAIALTLLALDLRVGEPRPDSILVTLAQLAPRLLIFVFAFLAIAQQWDVHRRTMEHVARIDATFFWEYALALMFVVLIPASADILGGYPLDPRALVVFGANIALICLSSWAMWRHAQVKAGLLEAGLNPAIAAMIGRLWLYPVAVIALTMPLAFLSVYPVYIL